MTDTKEVAVKLLKAISLPDSEVFPDLSTPRYTTIDYYRMACHILFECQRCATCCTTGDPIRLRQEDAARLARHLKIPLNKAIKKYTVPDPDKPGALDFKHILPCKFYDAAARGCKIYSARPWSCRIFPFLGVYGSEDQVKVHESCPGSVETMKILTAALEEARSDPALSASGPDEVRQAKEWLKRALSEVQNIDNL
ncbi:MAG TPA: YkgJ family cysteine cluster protein [Methanotrichaceae archaeon]|nr:YkgJ family cysteine cluster protein [Methanotrichaceae archaeon]